MTAAVGGPRLPRRGDVWQSKEFPGEFVRVLEFDDRTRFVRVASAGGDGPPTKGGYLPLATFVARYAPGPGPHAARRRWEA